MFVGVICACEVVGDVGSSVVNVFAGVKWACEIVDGVWASAVGVGVM